MTLMCICLVPVCVANFFFLNIYLFIWLCWVLVAAREIFVAACKIFVVAHGIFVVACGIFVVTRGIFVVACVIFF